MKSVKHDKNDEIADVVTVSDYRRQARRFSYNPLLPNGDENCQLMRGRNAIVQLRQGLYIHFSETTDLEDSTIAAECPPHIGVKVFLSGHVDASIGGLAIPMPRSKGLSWEPIAVLLSQPRKDLFVRKATKGGHLRKVTVSFTQDWLKDSGYFDGTNWNEVEEFVKCHLAVRTWLPSSEVVLACEQILRAPPKSSIANRLFMESRALVLVEEAIRNLLREPNAIPKRAKRPSDLQKLQALDDYVDTLNGEAVTSADIAKHIGTSENSLRRLIRNNHGMSLLGYVRRRQLENAKKLLEQGEATITQAAHIAGYNSAANFSTAFKRLFHVNPSQVIAAKLAE